MNLANFQHPELITMRQDAALTNTDIQSLRDEISALSKRIQEPVKVHLVVKLPLNQMKPAL